MGGHRSHGKSKSDCAKRCDLRPSALFLSALRPSAPAADLTSTLLLAIRRTPRPARCLALQGASLSDCVHPSPTERRTHLLTLCKLRLSGAVEVLRMQEVASILHGAIAERLSFLTGCTGCSVRSCSVDWQIVLSIGCCICSADDITFGSLFGFSPFFDSRIFALPHPSLWNALRCRCRRQPFCGAWLARCR
jgi:hypothetical protein